MFSNCDTLPKGDLLDMFVSGIHSRHSLWEFQASTPCQKLELFESRVRSAISALDHACIMPIPSLQLQKKPVICREAEGLVTELWSQELLQYSDCAVSCAMRVLQTNEQVLRLSF